MRRRNRQRLLIAAVAGIGLVSIILFLPRTGGFDPEGWRAWSGDPQDCSRMEMVGAVAGTIGMFASSQEKVTGLYGPPDRAQAATGGRCIGYRLGECGPVADTPYELRVCFDAEGRTTDSFIEQVPAN